MDLKPLRYFALSFFMLALAAPAVFAKSLEEDLIYRASFGRVADVEILLGQGANPNAADASGATALAVASDRNEAESIAIAEALLKAGADPNQPDHAGNYPIFNAIRQKNGALVQLLLGRGAKYDVTDGNGNTPAQLAEKLGDGASRAFILEAMERDRAALAMLRSAENLKKLTYTAAYESCAEAYYGVTLADQPAGAGERKAELAAIAGERQKTALAAARDIRRIFGLKERDVAEVITGSQAAIRDEVGWLGEKRKRAPFGTEADMHKRCAPIAGRWQIKWDPKPKR